MALLTRKLFGTLLEFLAGVYHSHSPNPDFVSELIVYNKNCFIIIGSPHAYLPRNWSARDHVGIQLELSNYNTLKMDNCNWTLTLRRER